MGGYSFVSVFQNEPVVGRCATFITEATIDTVEYSAKCKDMHDRSVIDSATSQIQAALEERLLFRGRFELVKGPQSTSRPPVWYFKHLTRRLSTNTECS
jgi:hypothetical protein